MAKREVDLRELVKRIVGTGDFIQYDRARCTGCGRCIKICPMNLWGLKKGKAAISPNYKTRCLECGSCWVVCQTDAIDFRYPNGGTGVTWEYG